MNGRTYNLAVNNGKNHLHGGIVGFDKRVWNSKILNNEKTPEEVGVLFNYQSVDGEEGYPGTLDVSTTSLPYDGIMFIYCYPDLYVVCIVL